MKYNEALAILVLVGCAKKEATVPAASEVVLPSGAPSTMGTTMIPAIATAATTLTCDETVQPGGTKREINLQQDARTYCVAEMRLKRGVLYKDIASSLTKDCSQDGLMDGGTIYRCRSGVDFHFGGPVLLLSRIVIHPKT
jgi:hypothetical protein